MHMVTGIPDRPLSPESSSDTEADMTTTSAAACGSIEGQRRQCRKQQGVFASAAGSRGTGHGSDEGSDAEGDDGPVESLQLICQRAVATDLVEPRTVLPILEYADVAGAQLLRSYCMAVALRNLDALIQEARQSLELLAPHLLQQLEQYYKHVMLGMSVLGSGLDSPSPARASVESPVSSDSHAVNHSSTSESASFDALMSQERGGQKQKSHAVHHLYANLQPGSRPTASAHWLVADQPTSDTAAASSSILEAAAQNALGAIGHQASTAQGHSVDGAPATALMGKFTVDGGKQAANEEAAARLRRNVLKKLQQISHLDSRQMEGVLLDMQQLAKVTTRVWCLP